MTAAFFLPGAIPERPQELPRRRLAALLAGVALAAGGAVAFYLPDNKPAPVPRPGPRRYPPGYKPKI